MPPARSPTRSGRSARRHCASSWASNAPRSASLRARAQWAKPLAAMRDAGSHFRR
jgi:hypothetical protein